MGQFNSFVDFTSAARFVLEFLHSKYGFNLWMVTRTEGDDWIVLEAEDHGYGVTSGDVFRWADSFCSQMVQGLGPCYAPNSSLVPAYSNAPIGRAVQIGAYVGIPLNDCDGGLFGTLCAIQPTPRSEQLTVDIPMIELLGRLLCSLLVTEMKLSDTDRRAEKLELTKLIDPLTHSLSVDGWNRVVQAEEVRCMKYGHPAHVLSFNCKDALTDEQLRRVAETILTRLSGDGCLARVEENQFLALIPECSMKNGAVIADELRKQFNGTELEIIVGNAARNPREDFASAIEHARNAN